MAQGAGQHLRVTADQKALVQSIPCALQQSSLGVVLADLLTGVDTDADGEGERQAPAQNGHDFLEIHLPVGLVGQSGPGHESVKAVVDAEG